MNIYTIRKTIIKNKTYKSQIKKLYNRIKLKLIYMNNTVSLNRIMNPVTMITNIRKALIQAYFENIASDQLISDHYLIVYSKTISSQFGKIGIIPNEYI